MASVALGPTRRGIPAFFSGHLGQFPDESILIYLAVAGSVTPMRVLESESIASVKLKIQSHKGFFVKNQKLVCDGRELARNESCVRDYGVTDGNILHLVIQLSSLQAITVRTVSGKDYEFHIERSRNVAYLKQRIAERGEAVFDIKSQELFCDGEELEDQRLIREYCKNNDNVIHLLICKPAHMRARAARPFVEEIEISVVASNINDKATDLEVREEHSRAVESTKHFEVAKMQVGRDFFLEHLIVNPKIQLPTMIEKLIRATMSGLDRGYEPIRSSEGTGGAYLMQDSSGLEFVSVFKPIDEEPMALNNPRGLPLSKDGEGLKKGTQVGEGALREVAAYILDHPLSVRVRYLSEKEEGFAGVPPTAMVKCLHPGFHHPNGYEKSPENIKIGSLQMYVKNSGSCEDMGPGAFPVEEVHKISVLDIRLANADRHAGNILVTKDGEGRIKLTPIDHGYCLPKNFEDCTFDWLYWPQARQPYSPDTLEYIKSLDAEEDIALLKFYGWKIPQDCVRVLRISTMLLKKGAEKGLTPFAIGNIMCRETLKKESVIELIVQAAEEAVLPGSSEAAFLETVSSIMDRYLDGISP